MRYFLSALLLGLAVFLGGTAQLPGPVSAVLAQETIELPDYDAWERVAVRAETAIRDNRASDGALNELRAELVDWRSRFLAAESINKTRIETLKNQIAALGPAPEEGVEEPADIAARRTELESQLAELEAPVRRAEEAFSRADGLIGEIDTLIRERQAARFFELTPSPANPVLWPQAFSEVADMLLTLRSEMKSAWSSAAGQLTLRENLPIIAIFLVAAVLLLWRGQNWVERIARRLKGVGPAAALRDFVVSLGQVVLPIAGVLALVKALAGTGLLGFRGENVVEGLVSAFIGMFIARWLALRLSQQTGSGILKLAPDDAARFRRQAGALGFLWGAHQLVDSIVRFGDFSEAARIVLVFPLVVLAGFLLARVGRTLRRSVASDPVDTDTDRTFRASVVDMLGRALMVVGLVGPVASLAGYTTAGPGIVFPTVLSLGLLAFLTIVSGVLRDLFAVVLGVGEDRAGEALTPVLLSLVLWIASLPLFALIWGARVSDLTEAWTSFMEGFQIGDTRISPTNFLTFAVVFAIGYMITRVLQSALRSSILPKTGIDPGGQSAIVSGVGYVGVFLAAVAAITAAGIDLSSLAIVAGALSVGIGFGLQNIVSNFVSGIILLIERPIAEGDWIEVGDQMGTVREISVRSTRIETFDRYDVIIPNADLVSGTVINYTHTNLVGRAVIKVGVAYGSDTKRVSDILQEIAAAHPMVLLNPAPAAHFVGFGADSLDFEVRALLRDVNFILTVKSDIHHEIARRFAEENIEIPFAQRDIWFRNPDALRGGPDTGGKSDE